MSESESEVFVSADEFESEDDSPLSPNLDFPKQTPGEILHDEPNQNEIKKDDNENEPGLSETITYRKRIERTRKKSPTTGSIIKRDFQPILDKVSIAKPEALINDLTSQLTNITKGLPSLHETSTVLKGIVLGKNVKYEFEPFVYDDDRAKETSVDKDSGHAKLPVADKPTTHVADQQVKISHEDFSPTMLPAKNEPVYTISKETVLVENDPEVNIAKSNINDEILKLSKAFEELNKNRSMEELVEKSKDRSPSRDCSPEKFDADFEQRVERTSPVGDETLGHIKEKQGTERKKEDNLATPSGTSFAPQPIIETASESKSEHDGWDDDDGWKDDNWTGEDAITRSGERQLEQEIVDNEKDTRSNEEGWDVEEPVLEDHSVDQVVAADVAKQTDKPLRENQLKQEIVDNEKDTRSNEEGWDVEEPVLEDHSVDQVVAADVAKQTDKPLRENQLKQEIIDNEKDILSNEEGWDVEEPVLEDHDVDQVVAADVAKQSDKQLAERQLEQEIVDNEKDILSNEEGWDVEEPVLEDHDVDQVVAADVAKQSDKQLAERQLERETVTSTDLKKDALYDEEEGWGVEEAVIEAHSLNLVVVEDVAKQKNSQEIHGEQGTLYKTGVKKDISCNEEGWDVEEPIQGIEGTEEQSSDMFLVPKEKPMGQKDLTDEKEVHENGWDAEELKVQKNQTDQMGASKGENLDNDGWDDWNDGFEEGNEESKDWKDSEGQKENSKNEELSGKDMTILLGCSSSSGTPNPVTKAQVIAEKASDGDGWDEWPEEEPAAGGEDDSWDSWGNKGPQQGAGDGWDDWGDDDPAPETTVDPKSPLKKEGKSAEESLSSGKDNEWRGWDTFGQKKEPEWGLSGWGINKLLSTATAVTSNLSHVIESGLGVPDPETFARLQKEEERAGSVQRPKEEEASSNSNNVVPSTASPFPFQNIVSGVGKIVEVAKVQELGSRVISGGLDTLETIGKKTMAVLQEGDPGLKKKRALLVEHGKMLSSALKEARDRALVENRISESEPEPQRRCQFETLLDDYQGLIHLEALEMLSRQCEIRIEQMKSGLSTVKLKELEETLEEVKELCEIDEDFDGVNLSDFADSMKEVVAPLSNELSVAQIIQVHGDLTEWFKTEPSHLSAGEIYDKAITVIAELTAAATMQYHKAGELLILRERRKTVQEADSFMQFSSYLCWEFKSITEKFTSLLVGKDDDPHQQLLLNNLHVESNNAVSYIKQAFLLLIPVLQLGAT